jgi:diadenosine tetraphosphate (Ap4A) HIT family hydrolase
VSADHGSPCFICEIVSGAHTEHHVWYEDDGSIAFLNRFPRLLGYSLVAPRRHLEDVTGDFTIEEYLSLQRTVYRVGEALREVLPTERLYILSLGSRQANAHVHWHVAPLPEGIPFDEQQFAAPDRPAVLAVSDADQKRLAAKLREAVTARRASADETATDSKRRRRRAAARPAGL